MSEIVSKLGEQLKSLLGPEEAAKVTEFIQQNEQPILIGIGVLSAFFVGKALLGRPPVPTPKKKHHKKKKKKHGKKGGAADSAAEEPKEAIEVIPPKEKAQIAISGIQNEFNSQYLPDLDKFFAAVDDREDQIAKAPKKGLKKMRREHTATKYQDSLKYKYLYFNESLLKLLMKLDGVDTCGDEVVRAERKQVINEIQGYCHKLDEYKEKVNTLEAKGVTA